ncbi:hypothetical protein [Subtercola lobariae]|uniref:DUF11 domain-containing protein n=1 Tax=Subtercola lobariae TaxID=1588641 RepID=A0A917BES1_9MICO|nr:hypothetical protein [Subtercola lobariae]GGF39858.1 hypothetical protein GCM10011399_35960 [Subtercola lobariae]
MDCLASTGLSVAGWLVLGTSAIGLGLVAWLVVRLQVRRGAAGAGLVCILVAAALLAGSIAPQPARASAQATCNGQSGSAHGGGGSGAAGQGSPLVTGSQTATPTPLPSATTPPTPVSTPTATPTPTDPIDLALSSKVSVAIVRDTIPTPINYQLTVSNTSSTDSTAPIVVKIAKNTAADAGGMLYVGPDWLMDTTTDPLNYLATYSKPIAAGTISPELTVLYVAVTTAGSDLELSASIEPGSGGDTNATNNSVTSTIKQISAFIDLVPLASVTPTTVKHGTPTVVAYTVTVANIQTHASEPGTVVRVRKHAEDGGGGISVTGVGWSVDFDSDPDNYVLTYSLAVAASGSSNPVTITYPEWTTATLFPVILSSTIDSDSGGDNNPGNNTRVINLLTS